jgi:hypothetical protein
MSTVGTAVALILHSSWRAKGTNASSTLPRTPERPRNDDASGAVARAISQQQRKRTEETFPWGKTIGGLADRYCAASHAYGSSSPDHGSLWLIRLPIARRISMMAGMEAPSGNGVGSSPATAPKRAGPRPEFQPPAEAD